MSKTASGFVLLAGLVVNNCLCRCGRRSSTNCSTPDKDWLMDLLNYGGIAIALAGICMFFYGAMVFARSEE